MTAQPWTLLGWLLVALLIVWSIVCFIAGAVILRFERRRRERFKQFRRDIVARSKRLRP